MSLRLINTGLTEEIARYLEEKGLEYVVEPIGIPRFVGPIGQNVSWVGAKVRVLDPPPEALALVIPWFRQLASDRGMECKFLGKRPCARFDVTQPTESIVSYVFEIERRHDDSANADVHQQPGENNPGGG